MYFLNAVFTLCSIYGFAMVMAMLLLWLNRKESNLGYGALCALLAITVAQCIQSMLNETSDPIPFLGNVATWPLLILFLGSFAVREKQKKWTNSIAAFFTFLIVLVWISNQNDPIISSIISTVGLALCIGISGYYFFGILQNNVYHDHRDTGKMLMLASTLLILSCFLIILAITHIMHLEGHTIVLKMAQVLGTIWCITLSIGLSLIRKASRQPIVTRIPTWKEEPDSFRFL